MLKMIFSLINLLFQGVFSSLKNLSYLAVITIVLSVWMQFDAIFNFQDPKELLDAAKSRNNLIQNHIIK